MAGKQVIVAIDGPAGAGKSTLAKRVAQRLGFLYINTGAMYRSVALWALRLRIDLSDTQKLEELAKAAHIELDPAGDKVNLNGEDITEALNDPAVSDAASRVSSVPGVRRALVAAQREMAADHSVVMEGRDIGTVVFPDAQIKIFLDAHPDERARRRAREREGADAEDVVSELAQRDSRDRLRAHAPLVQAPDAELIDTTQLSVNEAEEVILSLVRARTSNGKAAAS
jgi:cytidylate kinase